MSLKARVDKLYAGSISKTTAKFVVLKDGKEVKKKIIGNNRDRVVEIIIEL